MYQPYPGSDTNLPEPQRPPAPPSVRSAVNWARITGTVLFALSTVDTIVGLTAPVAALVKLWALIVWLVALAAIVFLWRRSSTAYFKGTPS